MCVFISRLKLTHLSRDRVWFWLADFKQCGRAICGVEADFCNVNISDVYCSMYRYRKSAS